MDQQAGLKRLREFVVTRRRELNLTQAGLASVSGLSKPTLSRLEQGTLANMLKLTSLEKLAKGLRVRLEELQELVTRGSGSATRALPRVLVAAGNDSLRLLLTKSLGRSGYAAVSAQDGDLALAVLNYAEPDALILDMDLPGITGRTLLRYLRRDLGYRGKIVALAEPDQADSELVGFGADALLQRGNTFSVQAVAETVERLLSSGRN